jgi:hypothetical protein
MGPAQKRKKGKKKKERKKFLKKSLFQIGIA